MPRMFQMLHIRAWAAETETPRPEWGYFLFWSQQWFAGLITFALFVLNQSHLRRLSTLPMLALVWIAMTSLSCAHCLLFLFILLTPPARKPYWYNTEWLHGIIGCVSLAQHIFVWQMMYFLNSPFFQRQLLFTSLLTLLVPLLSWIVPKTPDHHRRINSVQESQTKVYFTTGLLSVTLCLFSKYVIFWRTVTDPEDHIANRLYLDHLDIRHFFVGISGLLKILKDDPSMGAVVCDGIFTFLLLLTWIAVSSVSLGGMIKCSIHPTLETRQRTVWDPRNDLGRALARAPQPPAYSSWVGEHLFWKCVVATALYLFGGLGWAAAAILGAGGVRLDP
ncbi:hypothetical protein AUEXF2481DRAFT_90108 [Aureobasidium subglaciale EXF-2481]|uniref:Uncharacterized protein n=1 Tax=Aureobasidium subglaciale (strain EXF-2481) TaxID=1043005 RepID=A0A074Z470_AURSE|nr:uncharacterized protein AUEXF2481DRAFT_90108 [Aureobasidium subglaciale EXF-2481]KEQ93801.1 hypothetical protein AUEXF2481DRAFT_90108 [Aureobasidium subglaciale EXF-2481]